MAGGSCITLVEEVRRRHALIDHIIDQRPTPCVPVAYKEHHSSESTLLKVKNDILLILNMEEQS